MGGVLEIIRPLDRDIARTREGLRGTFVLMAAVAGALLACSGLIVLAEVAPASRERPPAVSRDARRVTRSALGTIADTRPDRIFGAVLRTRVVRFCIDDLISYRRSRVGEKDHGSLPAS